jgi:hypothetical protein
MSSRGVDRARAKSAFRWKWKSAIQRHVLLGADSE